MNELTPEENENTPNFLADSLQNLVEGLTGITTSERKELKLSVGYILQSFRKKRFLDTLIKEWNKYRHKGRIPEDYLDSEQHFECLQEMLDFLDNDSPDNIRFSVLKNVFLNTATEQQSTRDDVLPQQLMRICRSLNSTEVLILQACYELKMDGKTFDSRSAREWRHQICQNSRLSYPDLVESQESSLEDKGLIFRRTDPDKSQFTQSGHFRLTGLGLRLCEFMTEYDLEDLTQESREND